MTDSEWKSLNHEYHTTYQEKDFNPDDPRWISRLHSQARVLNDAAQIELLNGNGQWLDYACGDGKLSELLEKESLVLQRYDKYMTRAKGYLEESDLVPRSFDFVITTSVFEHFTLREQFDSVEALVSHTGGSWTTHSGLRKHSL